MENVILIPIEELESRINAKLDTRFEEIKSYIKNLADGDQQDDILSFKEGCALLNIAEPTGYSKISKREIPFMKRGKFIYFSKKQLIEWLYTGKKKTVRELEQDAKNLIQSKAASKTRK